jgi:hypothetical protein
MYRVALLGLMVIASSSSFAKTLKCTVGDEYDNVRLIYKSISGACRGNDNSTYKIKVSGVGFIVEGRMNYDFTLRCPKTNNPEGTYFGGQGSVGIALGYGVMTFAGKNGLCTANGVDLIFGTDISANVMKISKLDCSKHPEQYNVDCESISRL